MSAHDDLLAHGLTVYEAANVLEKHAHELAEGIRQEIQLMKDHGVLEPDKDWAASSAANFIDPSAPDEYR